MTLHAVCGSCRHPRPMHDGGAGICKARSCRAGPGHGPCQAFAPAGARAPEPVTAAAGPVPPMLVDVRAAMKILKLGRSTILNLSDSGELHKLRFGRAVRFAVNDLADLVERKKHEAQPPGGHRKAG